MRRVAGTVRSGQRDNQSNMGRHAMRLSSPIRNEFSPSRLKPYYTGSQCNVGVGLIVAPELHIVSKLYGRLRESAQLLSEWRLKLCAVQKDPERKGPTPASVGCLSASRESTQSVHSPKTGRKASRPSHSSLVCTIRSDSCCLSGM